LAERWREQIVADDEALSRWISEHPGLDAQQLRALVRQARKDHLSDAKTVSQGLAPRQGRAFRELFHLIKSQINASHA
jgi:ribosome-associated protein